MFLEGRVLALLRKNQASMVHTIRVRWQVTTPMRAANFQTRVAVEHAFKNHVRKEEGGFERVADHISQYTVSLHAARDPCGICAGLGMHEYRSLQLFRLRPEDIVLGRGKLLALNAASDGR